MDQTINWLLQGDAAIRWQTLRDLCDAPEQEWQAARQQTISEGWGAQFLALQDSGGTWGGGIYSPKWISTTYTLLALCSIGIPGEHAGAGRGAQLVIDRILGETCDSTFQRRLAGCDRCIVGMILQIALTFGITDERIDALVENLRNEQMPDGGWNCRRGRDSYVHHSSFHTTANVLDGLRVYLESEYPARHVEVSAAEERALEFMLQHHLYRSDRTGEVIEPQFTQLSFPTRWKYDVLRGLEYFARAGQPYDPRLEDGINLLMKKQRKDGRWPVQRKHAGRVFFDMEQAGQASRWNTLRALRVLRWWQQVRPPAASA